MLSFDRIRLGVQAGSSGNPTSSTCTLLFLHALLACRDHFTPFTRHLSKALASKNLSADSYMVDARNHGDSPWFPSHRLGELSDDVRHFIHHHRLPRFPDFFSTPIEHNQDNHSFPRRHQPLIVIGHSMGGKTALHFALHHPTLLDGVVSLDASSAEYTHSHDNVFTAMRAVRFDADRVRSQRDVDEQLVTAGLTTKNERAFVLSNNLRRPSSSTTTLSSESSSSSASASASPSSHQQSSPSQSSHQPHLSHISHSQHHISISSSSVLPSSSSSSSASSSSGFGWRCNLDTLIAFEHDYLKAWPTPSTHPPFQQPALFIGGTLSTRLTQPEYLKQV